MQSWILCRRQAYTMTLSPTLILTLLGTLVSVARMEILGERLSSEYLLIQPRVIGGAEVLDRCRPPYNSMVGLQFETSTGPVTFCSAVMLNETILVTSGFCAAQIADLVDIPVTAVIGEKDLNMKDAAEQRINIETRKVHPGYNASTFDNNIALLRLTRAATLSYCVKPAFKMESDPAACSDMDQSCLMAGWGPFVESSRPSNSRLPRYASVTVLGEAVTSLLSLSTRGVDSPLGSLYAETTNPNIKACFFDWGGIVSCIRNGKYALRGIIGEHNCNSDTSVPILVTDVSYFESWTSRCLANWAAC